jgi:hypothetical protein
MTGPAISIYTDRIRPVADIMPLDIRSPLNSTQTRRLGQIGYRAGCMADDVSAPSNMVFF